MKRIATTERPGWDEKAEQLGFTWRHLDGARYWDERAYYAFSLAEIEEGIEAPARELHAMCLDLVDDVVTSEELMAKLAIPEASRDDVAESWARRDPTLYGRFDFAYDGTGPAKLYEYNADTPTSIYESGAFQWIWLEDMIAADRLPADADQFNSLHEKLEARFRAIFPGGGFVHFASDADSVEDRQTVKYLEDIAGQAGIEPKFVPVGEIGLTADQRFVDQDGYVIQALFKLYPWEEMFREEYGANIKASKTRFLEPAWKAVLSNKGMLPLLWARNAGHPNLLAAYFEDDPRAAELGASYVRKPLFSREGANIELVKQGRKARVLDLGYGEEGHIRQALHEAPAFEGAYPVVGAWIVGDEPAGIGIREDRSRVTKNLSRFIPHAIVG
ncbi:MAG: glutathionylspermidine synthase family protein [Phenylobacterium sp.]|uniref:glutathionylspermidine synthase family protein n=1 Tax=Phenylobacterium sp. TaxID=1871053 RepID=UPI001A5B1031|nr:glutathionylspermidine synthase family protein [Phenylobacterium sp.]MBL8556468.1 glutathionylspermidine synthase family protein [Phenylobacterium sp.]